MSEIRFRESVALSSQIFVSSWSTHDENFAKERARKFAMLMAMKERDSAKPRRSSRFDGEISKRRDRS